MDPKMERSLQMLNEHILNSGFVGNIVAEAIAVFLKERLEYWNQKEPDTKYALVVQAAVHDTYVHCLMETVEDRETAKDIASILFALAAVTEEAKKLYGS